MLKKVKYVGLFDEVSIDRPGGISQVVRNGEVIEVPQEMAESLCEQSDNWELVSGSKAGKDES